MLQRPDEVNKMQHNTYLYSSNRLIVRRGQEFQVKIVFNRTYKPAEDKFALEFAIGEPSLLTGTTEQGNNTELLLTSTYIEHFMP